MNFIKDIGVNRMNVIRLMKKFLATLLFAFVVVAMVPACSSSEEEEAAPAEQEVSGGDEGCPEGSTRPYPECLPF